MYDSLAQRLAECDHKIEVLLAALGLCEVTLMGAPKRGGKNTLRFDLRRAPARWAGVDLTRINGLAVTSALTALSEIGLVGDGLVDLRALAQG
jgi:transposase